MVALYIDCGWKAQKMIELLSLFSLLCSENDTVSTTVAKDSEILLSDLRGLPLFLPENQTSFFTGTVKIYMIFSDKSVILLYSKNNIYIHVYITIPVN